MNMTDFVCISFIEHVKLVFNDFWLFLRYLSYIGSSGRLVGILSRKFRPNPPWGHRVISNKNSVFVFLPPTVCLSVCLCVCLPVCLSVCTAILQCERNFFSNAVGRQDGERSRAQHSGEVLPFIAYLQGDSPTYAMVQDMSEISWWNRRPFE